ncbi:mechanosensitive ion channel family protein [Vibrio sp. FNV 38]|nr:mechanosensitive ion channel family protein [Vibrio sp. FNV 38]
MDVIYQAIDFFSAHKFVFTILVLVCIYGLRRIILSQIRGDDVFVTQEQRKWMATTKNFNLLIIVIVLFYLWQSEINEFALSVTAIAVAIVVASKEIILCFTGSIQRASSRSFQIGDWIEVGKYCGEVIDHNLMATVIQEIDLHHGQYDYTGKTITLPNSLFFTHPVKNLNFMKRYVFHSFSIIVPKFVNLYTLMDDLEQRIEAHCEYFIEVARRYNIMIEKHAGVDLPSAEPHVHISSMPNGEQNVHIMLFCPTDKAIHLEQDIRKDFMELYDAKFGE